MSFSKSLERRCNSLSLSGFDDAQRRKTLLRVSTTLGGDERLKAVSLAADITFFSSGSFCAECVGMEAVEGVEGKVGVISRQWAHLTSEGTRVGDMKAA
jgi:hypothetical protein